jgi:hypothetical protein
MIIWGSKAKQHTVGTGVFFCPNCRLDATYEHLRVSRYFTLYFIPLFRTSTLGEGIECKSCAAQFNLNVLQLNRQEILTALQPWLCSCGNHNPKSESACLACGLARPPAMPPPLPANQGLAALPSSTD